jgi:hypothetical protein
MDDTATVASPETILQALSHPCSKEEPLHKVEEPVGIGRCQTEPVSFSWPGCHVPKLDEVLGCRSQSVPLSTQLTYSSPDRRVKRMSAIREP